MDYAKELFAKIYNMYDGNQNYPKEISLPNVRYYYAKLNLY